MLSNKHLTLILQVIINNGELWHIAEMCHVFPSLLHGITRICYGKKEFIENIGILQLKVPRWSPSAKKLDVSPLPAVLESAWRGSYKPHQCLWHFCLFKEWSNTRVFIFQINQAIFWLAFVHKLFKTNRVAYFNSDY